MTEELPVQQLDVFDVPLTELDGRGAVVHDGAGEPPRTNWRRAIAVAGIAGATIGVAGALVFSGANDDPDEVSPTLPPEEVAAGITTPPTMRPLDAIPPPDDPALNRPSVDEGPQPTTSQDRSLFESGVTLPSYPPVTDVGLPDLVLYDIGEAVDRLGEDRARRSETHLELGTAGFLLDVVIERNPTTDRYRLAFESGDETQGAVIDIPTDRMVITRPDGEVVELPATEVFDVDDVSAVRQAIDRLLVGPLRPESYNAVATRGRGVVTLGEFRVAREFRTAIQGALIPEWQLYAFSPVFEFPVEDRPSVLEYSAYVSEDGDLVQINGLSLVGDVPQLVEHRIVEPTDPIAIELPPPIPAIDTPTTPAPTAPTTTLLSG